MYIAVLAEDGAGDLGVSGAGRTPSSPLLGPRRPLAAVAVAAGGPRRPPQRPSVPVPVSPVHLIP